jgi:hypothetical protein
MICYWLVAFVALSSLVRAQEPKLAPGSIEVSFQTQPYHGKYSPRHVLAVWVVDADSKYVKTLAVYGRKHVTKLGRWRKAVGKIKVDAITSATHHGKRKDGKPKTDAITGATRRQHEPLTVVWNGTDDAGKVVPDGNYKVRFEYTETSRLGPAFEIAIAKGGKPGSEKVKGSKYFTDITVHTVGPKAN